MEFQFRCELLLRELSEELTFQIFIEIWHAVLSALLNFLDFLSCISLEDLLSSFSVIPPF